MDFLKKWRRNIQGEQTGRTDGTITGSMWADSLQVCRCCLDLREYIWCRSLLTAELIKHTCLIPIPLAFDSPGPKIWLRHREPAHEKIMSKHGSHRWRTGVGGWCSTLSQHALHSKALYRQGSRACLTHIASSSSFPSSSPQLLQLKTLVLFPDKPLNIMQLCVVT